MSERTVVHGAPVFDPGALRFEEDCAVVVERDRVVELRRPAAVREGEVELDLSGRWVLPGLIDAHRHLIDRSAEVVDDDLIARGVLEGIDAAAATVRAGVTFVRDAGCRHRGIYALRAALAAGKVVGPKLYAAGPNVAGRTADRSWRNVIGSGPDEVRALVRAEAEAGADWIKLIVSQAMPDSGWRRIVRHLDDAEIGAAIDEAHAHGLAVGCHCEGDEAAAALVRAGVDCIDHGTGLSDATLAAMASAGTRYVPTAWMFSTATVTARGEVAAADAASYRDAVERGHADAIRRALRAGVPIAAGTDGDEASGYQLAAEVEALVAVGLPAAVALRAATLEGAAVCGRSHERGSLEPGKVADLVAIGSDPLRDPAALRDVELVVQDGRTVVDERRPIGVAA